MNLLNNETNYMFHVTYNNGESGSISCSLDNIQDYARSSYYFPRKDVDSGVKNIRLVGETGALQDSYWDGFHTAKDMSRIKVLTGRW